MKWVWGVALYSTASPPPPLPSHPHTSLQTCYYCTLPPHRNPHISLAQLPSPMCPVEAPVAFLPTLHTHTHTHSHAPHTWTPSHPPTPSTASPTHVLRRPGGGVLEAYFDLLAPASQAQEVCVLAGGNLVSVTSEAINLELLTLGERNNMTLFWIGLWSGPLPPNLTASYRWMSGAVSDYNGWPHQTERPPVSIQVWDTNLVYHAAWSRFPNNKGQLGGWMHLPPAVRLPFVCERL